MIVYAESSAVLAWLFGEARGGEVMRHLAGAERVVASALTPLECARALERETGRGRVTAHEALATRGLLDEATRGWALLELSEPVLARAARRFPVEPVRTLDALHLATSLEAHESLGDLVVLSLDERVRANATALGIAVAPSA